MSRRINEINKGQDLSRFGQDLFVSVVHIVSFYIFHIRLQFEKVKIEIFWSL